jgi:pyruvate dehydrogenase E2 component (dihydrolipoamide acetyltransferase)
MVSFPEGFPFVRRLAESEPQPVESAPVETAPVAVEPVAEPAPFAAAPEPVAPTPAPVVMSPAPVAPPPARIVPAHQIPIHERRKAKRDPLLTPALVRLDNLHGPPVKVDLSDISVLGVRLRSNQPLQVGEKGQIRLDVGPLRWTTRLRVVYSQVDEHGTHTVGCAFLRTELLRPWPAAA